MNKEVSACDNDEIHPGHPAQELLGQLTRQNAIFLMGPDVIDRRMQRGILSALRPDRQSSAEEACVTPLAFTMPSALAFWAVLTWAFVPEFALTSRSRRPAPYDRGSLPLMVFGLGAANAVALPLAFVESTQFLPSMRYPLFAVGLGLVVVGSLLRRHCRRVLGRHFTSAVAVEPGQPVIERGAYGWVRHPSYTAGLLLHLGYGLALANWGSILLVLGMCAAVYAYRIAVEEWLLTEVLGEPYRDYMRRHRRLVPYVF